MPRCLCCHNHLPTQPTWQSRLRLLCKSRVIPLPTFLGGDSIELPSSMCSTIPIMLRFLRPLDISLINFIISGKDIYKEHSRISISILNNELLITESSCDQCTSSGVIISPVWSHLLGSSVVSGQSVDSAFNQNQSVFTVFVFSVLLHMFSNSQCSFDHAIQVFRNFRGTSVFLQNSQYFSSSEEPDLRNTMLVSQQDTDLRWSQSLLSQLDDQFSDGLTIHGDPLGCFPFVRECWTTNTFSFYCHLHSSHLYQYRI